MVKAIDVVNEVCYLANRGIGVDADGYFGSQCADEIVYLIMKYFYLNYFSHQTLLPLLVKPEKYKRMIKITI